jgi:hypothetical protein
MKCITIAAFAGTAVLFAGAASAQQGIDFSKLSRLRLLCRLSGEPAGPGHDLPDCDNRSVPARVYTVRQNNSVFTVTVADLANTGLDERTVIDHAMKTLSAGGKVIFDIPHRIYRVYGRQFAMQGADGSRSTVSVFDYNGRLYQLEAKALPGASDGPAETLRFEQSLVFTDGGSNRSEDTIRAIREGCRSDALNGAGNPINPAGLDDPRCQVPR